MDRSLLLWCPLCRRLPRAVIATVVAAVMCGNHAAPTGMSPNARIASAASRDLITEEAAPALTVEVDDRIRALAAGAREVDGTDEGR